MVAAETARAAVRLHPKPSPSRSDLIVWRRAADCENHLRRHLANPFLVLELAPEAGRSELERQGAKLLAMLAAGLAAAGTYATPLGPRERTAEMVREALNRPWSG